MIRFRFKSVSAFALFHPLASLYRIIYSSICHVGRCFSVMLSVLMGEFVCIKVKGWMGVLISVRIVAVSQSMSIV